MAGHLQRAGHDVTVFNRTRAKSDRWAAQFGGMVAATPAETARSASVVFSCVGNDDDVRSVTTGPDGAFAAMARGAVFVDHTTTSARLARELSLSASETGFGFLDAPISGGQSGAENGILTVMVGGAEEDFTRARPLIECYARQIKLLGPSGSGQLAKMVNQICIAGLVQGLSEGLNFAENAGLDPLSVIEVISKGAAQSWQMDNRHQTMIEDHFDHGFAVDWMLKDLRIALDEAQENGSSLPVTALVEQFYRDIRLMGGGRWDTSSLIRRLRRFDDRSEESK
jgi:3-hydroxyisobutyrate dehydrogenase-like beta-hydroxyacid dehydrogenase